MEIAAQKCFVGDRAGRGPRRQRLPLGGQEPPDDARGHLARHGLLDREHVGAGLIERLAPHLDAARRANQLGGKAQASARAPHTAAHQVRDIERAADRRRILERGAAVAPHQVAAPHREPLDPREPVDDFFGDAVGEIEIVRVARAGLEVENGDAVGRGRRGDRPNAAARRRRAVGALGERGPRREN